MREESAGALSFSMEKSKRGVQEWTSRFLLFEFLEEMEQRRASLLID